MFHTVFLETDRVGDFSYLPADYANVKTYTTEPFFLGVEKNNESVTTLKITLNCVSKKYGKSFVEIYVTNSASGRSKYYLISENGDQTEMYSEFDVQFVTPLKNPEEARIDIDLPEHFCIGHRGFGMNTFCKDYLENTVESVLAGYRNGLKWAEFDIQYTKEGIPVIFHDFTLKSKNLIGNTTPTYTFPDHYEYAIEQLSLDEFLQTGYDTEWNTPACTFKDFLTKIPEEIYFDIEIKSIYEEAHIAHEVSYPDRNFVIDAIMEDLEKYGKNRKFFFSCFDPMIIIMLCLKGSKYPMLQLSCQEKWETEELAMNRLNTLIKAYQELPVKGFVLDSELVFTHEHLIEECQKHGFRILTYGKANYTADGVDRLLKLGLGGICTDNIPLVLDRLKAI